MDCIRLPEKTQTIFDKKGTIISNAVSKTFLIGPENAEACNALKRQRKWSTSDRVTYGKVLLSFLMNNLQVNRSFVNHLAVLLKKTGREVSIFHRKMLSQHRTPAVIVTHILRKSMEKPSHQTQAKLPVLAPLNLIYQKENFIQQEQKLTRREKDFLWKLVFVQESLEQYQENLSEDGEVEDLDDFYFSKQERTRDSYDFDQNNEQGAEQEDSTIDCVSR